MRRRWTTDLVLQGIVDRRAGGRPLNAKAVNEQDTRLYGAAVKRFGNWRRALVAAGIDPRTATRYGHWSREEIARQMLALHAAGRPMHAKAVYRAHRRLFAAAARVHRSWGAALIAVGIGPVQIRNYQTWSREKVIRRIRMRHADGKPIHAGAVDETDTQLYQAAKRWFGTWAEAIAAAGLPRELARRYRAIWTRTSVIGYIRKTHMAGGRINSHAFYRESVLGAATRLFGTWDNALQAAGFDPTAVRIRRRNWTKAEILQTIRRKRKAGEAVNSVGIGKGGMVHAALRLFGSWDEALRATGCDPAAIRIYRRPWTKSEIMAILQRKYEAGESVNYANVQPVSLCKAGIRLFGSWSRALRAAGLNPDAIRFHGPRGAWPFHRRPRQAYRGS